MFSRKCQSGLYRRAESVSNTMAEGQAFTLADTWLLNNRVNRMLLHQLTDAQFAYRDSARTRSIGEQMAHLHNVRATWLKAIANELLDGIEKGAATKENVAQGLEASGARMARVLAEAEHTGKLRGYKRGPVAFLGYLLAHEAHHRGEILIHLKHAKMPVDKAFGFSLWEWDKI